MRIIFLLLFFSLLRTTALSGHTNTLRLAIRASLNSPTERIDIDPEQYQLSKKQSELLEKHLKQMEAAAASLSCQKKPHSIRCRLSSLLRLFGYIDPKAKETSKQ